MILKEGIYDVPNGHVAAVVTHLEMTAPTMPARLPFPDGVTVSNAPLDNDTYRDLFRAVGGPWLWTSRLLFDDRRLAALLSDPKTVIWVVRDADRDIGLIELDFSKAGECELVLFGIMADATGKGLGKPMMALAQSEAFARGISRFEVHTCSLDDPRALGFYRRMGFTPIKRAIEIFPDPRLSGAHDITAAPQIPCLK